MAPLAATADALDLLAVGGDDGPRRRVAWISEIVTDVVPHADAVAVRFLDEDLTLVLVMPAEGEPRTATDLVVRSSLGLRIAADARDIAVVTIYSERARAFDGRVGLIERAHGAVVGASVLDDDLSLDAARRAGLAPAQLRARMVVDTAIGLLMGTHGFGPDEAEAWLDRAARAGGRTRLEVATDTVAPHGRAEDDRTAPLVTKADA